MPRYGFKLRSKTYHLTKEEVERRLKAVASRPPEKYTVIVEGKAFPPKQVLSEALSIPVLSFTTMDATRILSKIGFEVIQAGEITCTPGNGKRDVEDQFKELRDYIDGRIRDMETHLLAEFRRWALRIEATIKPHPAPHRWARRTRDT